MEVANEFVELKVCYLLFRRCHCSSNSCALIRSRSTLISVRRYTCHLAKFGVKVRWAGPLQSLEESFDERMKCFSFS